MNSEAVDFIYSFLAPYNLALRLVNPPCDTKQIWPQIGN